MRIAIKEKTDKQLTFVLSESTTSFANLLRRYALTRVPTFAIEDVTFYENSTSFHDEYIAHRLGLIPLLTPAKARGEVLYSLEGKGPKTLYAEDMKTKDEEVKPAAPRIPIIKLAEGQAIKLEAKAILGRGKDHAKWQPGLISYGYDEEGTYNFTIDSFGQMTAIDILRRALAEIERSAMEIAKCIKMPVR